jgi:hypothetical protein
LLEPVNASEPELADVTAPSVVDDPPEPPVIGPWVVVVEASVDVVEEADVVVVVVGVVVVVVVGFVVVVVVGFVVVVVVVAFVVVVVGGSVVEVVVVEVVVGFVVVVVALGFVVVVVALGFVVVVVALGFVVVVVLADATAAGWGAEPPVVVASDAASRMITESTIAAPERSIPAPTAPMRETGERNRPILRTFPPSRVQAVADRRAVSQCDHAAWVAHITNFGDSRYSEVGRLAVGQGKRSASGGSGVEPGNSEALAVWAEPRRRRLHRLALLHGDRVIGEARDRRAVRLRAGERHR